jgi:hypothetical protein
MSRPLGSYDGCAGGCLCFAPDASYAACTQKRSIREPGINQPAWASLKGLSRIVYTSESPQTPHDARILRIDFYAPTWVASPHPVASAGCHGGRQRLLVRGTQPAGYHLIRPDGGCSCMTRYYARPECFDGAPWPAIPFCALVCVAFANPVWRVLLRYVRRRRTYHPNERAVVRPLRSSVGGGIANGRARRRPAR